MMYEDDWLESAYEDRFYYDDLEQFALREIDEDRDAGEYDQSDGFTSWDHEADWHTDRSEDAV